MSEAPQQPQMTAYTFLRTPAPTAEALSAWPRLHDPFPHVVGFSRLGHVFLQNPETGQFAVLYPLEGGMKAYDAADMDEFRATVLDDPGFQQYILPSSLMAAVVERLGPIAPNEVYMPVPYPMLGGSGAPETYDKGDVWVFLEIVGQIWQQN